MRSCFRRKGVAWHLGVIGYWCNHLLFSAIILPDGKGPIRNRIDRARQNVDATGQLLLELEHDLSTRTKVLEQIQADAERYERLVSVNIEQAKAIENMISRQFGRQALSARWQWWGLIVLVIIFGFIVNWLSAPLLDWLIRSLY